MAEAVGSIDATGGGGDAAAGGGGDANKSLELTVGLRGVIRGTARVGLIFRPMDWSSAFTRVFHGGE